jgi:thiamine-phosphate pyrophosphorylase
LPKHISSQRNTRPLTGVYRIIDANINRSKEGLRVCEEIARFILCDRALTARFKAVRHALEAIIAAYRADPRLIFERASCADVGRTIASVSELRRRDWQDVFAANLQRVKESVRVLEEFSKLIDVRRAQELKSLRYSVYELERRIMTRDGNTSRRSVLRGCFPGGK